MKLSVMGSGDDVYYHVDNSKYLARIMKINYGTNRAYIAYYKDDGEEIQVWVSTMQLEMK